MPLSVRVKEVKALDDFILSVLFVSGCGISWNEDIDISECELWENGILNQNI